MTIEPDRDTENTRTGTQDSVQLQPIDEDAAFKNWRRRFFWLLAAWIVTTFLLSFSDVRGIVAYPLWVHDEDASGDAAYVMADGYAYWERLHAASDLYHLHKVPKIIVLDEPDPAGFNFVNRRSETRLEKAIAYLVRLGVPEEKIDTINVDPDAWLGSLSEAKGVAKQYPELNQIVVVTSAPHTRRSRLCFQRTHAQDVRIQIFSASVPARSVEVDTPIWPEYAKLLVYFFAA